MFIELTNAANGDKVQVNFSQVILVHVIPEGSAVLFIGNGQLNVMERPKAILAKLPPTCVPTVLH